MKRIDNSKEFFSYLISRPEYKHSVLLHFWAVPYSISSHENCTLWDVIIK